MLHQWWWQQCNDRMGCWKQNKGWNNIDIMEWSRERELLQLEQIESAIKNNLPLSIAECHWHRLGEERYRRWWDEREWERLWWQREMATESTHRGWKVMNYIVDVIDGKRERVCGWVGHYYVKRHEEKTTSITFLNLNQWFIFHYYYCKLHWHPVVMMT